MLIASVLADISKCQRYCVRMTYIAPRRNMQVTANFCFNGIRRLQTHGTGIKSIKTEQSSVLCYDVKGILVLTICDSIGPRLNNVHLSLINTTAIG